MATREYVPERPLANKLRLEGSPTLWRRAMWVVLDGQFVGILDSLVTLGAKGVKIPLAEVHVVDAAGKTIQQVKGVRYDRIRQARWDEIPPGRRPIRVKQLIDQGYLRPGEKLDEEG